MVEKENNYVKFYHFRYLCGKLHTAPVKNPDSHGGITVAVREDNGKLFFGAAKCSTLDVYSKQYGRIRSVGISKSKDALQTEVLDKQAVTDIAVQIAKNVDSKIGIQQSLMKAKP